MGRPQHKDELLTAAATEFERLRILVDGMSETERDAPCDYGPGFAKPEAHWTRDRNVRDVLAHLFEWHRLLLNWVAENEQGSGVPFLPAPYTWRNYGEMNLEFCRRHQDTPFAEAWRRLQGTHGEVMLLIGRFTDDELFEKAHFSWTGTTSLGSYCVSATSSHYAWARKKLRLHLRQLRA